MDGWISGVSGFGRIQKRWTAPLRAGSLAPWGKDGRERNFALCPSGPWSIDPPEQIANSQMSASCKRRLREGGWAWTPAGRVESTARCACARAGDLRCNCFQQNTALLCN